MKAEIFVQIAAYRDSETLPTLLDALEKARYPERIRVGLCWQYIPGTDEAMLPAAKIPHNVRLISVDARESEGVCWARSLVQALYQGETYTLSIDSHTRFEADWDVCLIDELNQCDSTHPVLSTYPAAYTQEGNDKQAGSTAMVLKNTVNGFPRFRTLLLDRPPEKPLRGLFVAGGFHFARGSIIRDAPYDPFLYFNQEELALSIKLWTRGYDVFSPTRSFLYHLYQENHQDRKLHWEDQAQWVRLEQRGHKRLQHLTGIEKSDDPSVTVNLRNYPLGLARNVTRFCEISGLKLGGEQSEAGAYLGEFIYRMNPDAQFVLTAGEQASC